MFKAQNNLLVKNGKLIRSRKFESANTGSVVNLQLDAMRDLASQQVTAASQETASNMELAYGDPAYGTGFNSISVSSIGTGSIRNLDRMLSGIVDERNEYAMTTLYRDIYNNDVTCGSAVDLTSTLPFSDFSLTGLEEKDTEIYMDSVSRLNLKTQFPQVSLHYLVDGKYLSTMIYDVTKKIFVDMLKHDTLNCHFHELPFISQDPLITVRQSAELIFFLSSSDPQIVQQRRNYSHKLLESLSAPEFTLDPKTTIYLPRQGMLGKPMSYFRRIIPIYLLEKMLVRGTIVEASKRQRAALHLQAGSDTWEPTPQELTALVSLFQQADFDPLSPTIATRNDINVSEVRQGGDFWKWTDIADELNTLKLRGLNISDSFLSGDQNYSVAESNLSVFIEGLKAYRDFLTQKVFYTHLFPIIAHTRDMKKENVKHKEQASGDSILFRINDTTQYRMPRVQWHKSLQPRNDHDTIDMLGTLAEKGVPVTLRMWAAAGGFDMSNIEEELNEDKALRKKIAEIVGVKTDDDGASGDYSGDSGGGGDEYSNIRDNSQFSAFLRSNRLGTEHLPKKPIGILARNFGESGEIVGRTKTGKKKYIADQRSANRKANETIAKAMKNLSDPSHYEDVKRRTNKRPGAAK